MFKPTEEFLRKIKNQTYRTIDDRNVEFEMKGQKLIFNDDDYFGDGQLNFSRAVDCVCGCKLLDRSKFEKLRDVAGKLNLSLVSEDNYNKRKTILCNVGATLGTYIELERCLEDISQSLVSINLGDLSLLDRIFSYSQIKNGIVYLQGIINYQMGILRANEVFFVALNSRLCDAVRAEYDFDFSNTSLDFILRNPQLTHTKVNFMAGTDGLKSVSGGRVSAVYENKNSEDEAFFKMGQIFLQPNDDNAQEISMGYVNENKKEEEPNQIQIAEVVGDDIQENTNPHAYEKLNKSPQQPNHIVQLAPLANTAFRANLAYELATLLNFGCIIKTQVGITPNDYVSIMARAHEKSAKTILNTEPNIQLRVSSYFITTILHLNIIDYILLSADRHDNNWFIDNRKGVLDRAIGIDNDFFNPREPEYEDLKCEPSGDDSKVLSKVNLSFLFIRSKIPFVTKEIQEIFADESLRSHIESVLILTLPNNKVAVQEILDRFDYARARILGLKPIVIEEDKQIINKFLEPANEIFLELFPNDLFLELLRSLPSESLEQIPNNFLEQVRNESIKPNQFFKEITKKIPTEIAAKIKLNELLERIPDELVGKILRRGLFKPKFHSNHIFDINSMYKKKIVVDTERRGDVENQMILKDDEGKKGYLL